MYCESKTYVCLQLYVQGKQTGGKLQERGQAFHDIVTTCVNIRHIPYTLVHATAYVHAWHMCASAVMAGT